MSVLVVTYNPDESLLSQCLTSVAEQTYRPVELLIIDNGSTPDVLDRVVLQVEALTDNDPDLTVSVHRLGFNSGFAHAINVGVSAGSGELCLLLNPDAVLGQGALGALVGSSQRNPNVVGFAPKVTLHAFPTILDSVGIAFAWNGDAFQRGLGELDLGQFDAPEKVPGVTMGATLIRMDAFDPDLIGGLDERFFMFLEDVDWSLRASLRGEQFLTVPDALVRHVGSQSARRRSYSWRYRLIERNVYFTAIKNYETRHLLGFLLRRTRSHWKNLVRGRYPLATIRALVEGWWGLYALRNERDRLRRQRHLSDKVVITTVPPAMSGMELISWVPIYSWPMLRSSIGRLYAVSGEERWGRVLRRLDAILRYDTPPPPEEILRRLENEGGPLPTEVLEYARNIVSA